MGHPGIYFVCLQGEKMLHLCAREGATDCLEFLINKGKGRQKKKFLFVVRRLRGGGG